MISVGWGNTYIIFIPQSYLTLVSGTLYSLDTNKFRLDLKNLEASLEGLPHPKTHNHNTEVTVAGIVFARTIEILPPYSVEFEDAQYTVQLSGSNNNIFDVQNGILIQNQVQVIPNNSAGLVQSPASNNSVWTESEKDSIISDILNIVLKLPSDGSEISGENDVSSGQSTVWTEEQKNKALLDLEIIKRQATKAVNNTERPS